jgi:cyclin H
MQPFTQSTHARCWIFESAEALAEERAKARMAAAERVASAAAAAGGEAAPPPLSVEEEALVRQFFERNLQTICKREYDKDPTRYSRRVSYAAQMYFKRFFLKASLVEADPKAVMLAALLVAGKVEQERIQIDDVVALGQKGQKLTADELLAMELKLCQTMSFQLMVGSPYRALLGYLQDLREPPDAADEPLPESDIGRLWDGAYAFIQKALTSDAPFLFAPQQIALAALLRADQTVGASVAVDAWLDRRFQFLGAPPPADGAAADGAAAAAPPVAAAAAEAVAGLRQRLAAVHAEVDGVDAQGEVDRARLKEIDGRRQAAHALLKQVKDAESEEEQQARRDHKKAKMEAREARSVVAIDGGGTTADEGFVLQKRQRTDEVKSER